jgi:hypothetical protein
MKTLLQRLRGHCGQIGLVAVLLGTNQLPGLAQDAAFPMKTGIQSPGIQHAMDELPKAATITIAVGIPGHGGEISFGAGSAWATETEFPLTRIDAKTNKVVAQWHGEGGDSVRYAFGTVWLTDLRGGKVWRIPVREH